MTVVTGMEWPDVELGPLCPGRWVEETDLESLPGTGLGAGEVWWPDSRDKGDKLAPHLTSLEALDARLSLELANAKWFRCEKARVQWSTDKVARAFFQVRTQVDLDNAFVLLSRTEERHHIAQSIIQMAVQRVVRLERKARQSYLDNLRELNRQMAEWARSVSYRVRLTGEQEPVAQRPRNQAWCLVELRPGIGQVCRGKDAGDKPVVMAEPEIFAFAAARTA